MNRNKDNLHPSGKLPRCHWNRKKTKNRRAKRVFESVEEAKQYIEKRRFNECIAYQCRECGKYHIGHRREEHTY